MVRELTPERFGKGQLPVTISTFTNERKLYLSPGVNMRTADHPDSFTEPVQPSGSQVKTKLIIDGGESI